MRIRTLKPEWLEDELLCAATSEARIMSVALILLADDYGNGRMGPTLPGRVFPRDPSVGMPALQELASMGFIQVYVVRRQRYYHLTNWDKHQKVDHPGKPRCPGPEHCSPEVLEKLSRDFRETLAPDLDQYQYQYQDQEGRGVLPPAGPTPLVLSSPTSLKPALRNGEEVAVVTESVVGAFNRVFERHLRPAAWEEWVKKLLAKGYTEAEMRAVVWWAGEEWADDPEQRVSCDPARLFKQTSSRGYRTFPQYLSLAEELWLETHDDTEPPPWLKETA